MNPISNQIFLSPSQQNIFFRIFAAPFSWVFSFVVFMRNFFYDFGIFCPRMLPGVVVSIGNIQVGGTGKTPFTIFLANLLIQRRSHVAILTRGYASGLAKDEYLVYLNGKIVDTNLAHEKQTYADEALLQSVKLPTVPVIVAANRYVAAKIFLSRQEPNTLPTHWLLDDGFQHRQLRRDFDIVLHQSSSTKLLPAGDLREPLRSLSRANCIFTSVVAASVSKAVDDVPIYSFVTKALAPTCVSDAISQFNSTKTFIAVSGIARPQRFFDSLAARRINIEKKLAIADHARFEKTQLQALCQQFSHCDLITTEKDYFRDPTVFRDLSSKVWVLPVEIFLTPETREKFVSLLQKKKILL